MEILVLQDWETNTQYELRVDAETAERAETDNTFARQLLEQFKKSGQVENNLYEDGLEQLKPAVEKSCERFSGALNEKQSNEWTREETLALIEAYDIHKEHFTHVKKRKVAWTNLALFLQSNGFNKSAKCAEIKWKNLLRTYKTIKDHNGRTGRGGISRFQFLKEMDEVLGDRPLISNDHTVGVGIHTSKQQEHGNNQTREEVLQKPLAATVEANEDLGEDHIEVINNSIKEKTKVIEKQKLPGNVSNILTLKKSYLKQKINESDTRAKERKEYLEFLKEERILKREREEQKLRLKEKELEIEEKRIKLLEKYLDKNNN